MKRITIEHVDNGFIVIVLEQGSIALKTRYDKPKYVFGDFKDLVAFLSHFYSSGEVTAPATSGVKLKDLE